VSNKFSSFYDDYLRYVVTFLDILSFLDDPHMVVTEADCFGMAPYSPLLFKKLPKENFQIGSNSYVSVSPSHHPVAMVLLTISQNHMTGWV